MTSPRTLQVISGPAAGQDFEIEHELIIGRRDADLAIADDELSRRHAAVRPSGEGIEVEDLGSLNGTFVNSERIRGAVTLTEQATVRVGRSEMTLHFAAGEPSQPEQEAQEAGDAGRTRLAATLPPQPDAPAPEATPSTPEPAVPIPQPQVTRVRPVADAELPAGAPEPGAAAPEPIPQPEVTRVRAIPQPEVTRVRAIPQPEVTRVRPIPDAKDMPPAAPPPPGGIPQPAVTRVRAVVPPDASGDQERQPKRPGPLKRLLARLRGKGKR